VDTFLFSERSGYCRAFFITQEFKYKGKTVGVARQQLHFLCSDKENEAKESLGCAGHVWRVKAFLLTFVAAWTKVRRLAVRELPT